MIYINIILSWTFQNRLCTFLHHEFGIVVWSFFSCYPIFHFGSLVGLMVRCICAFDLCWGLFRIPETFHWTSGSDQSDPKANPRTKYLHPTYSWHCHGRCLAFWMYIYSIILCFEFDLVITNLLYVRIFVFGICHFDYYLFRDNHFALLFSSLCWSKYTTYNHFQINDWNFTKFFKNLFFQDYHWWWRSFLTSGFTAFYLFVYCVHYFMTKLDIEGSASTFLYFGFTSIMVFMFFLLTGKIFYFFFTNIFWIFFYRNYWILCLLLVCEKNLQCCQSRLNTFFKRNKKKPRAICVW